MLRIPLLFVPHDVGELIESDDIVLLELTAHQDAVRCTREMKAYSGSKAFHLFVIIIVLSRFVVLGFRLFLILVQFEHFAVFLSTGTVMCLINDEQVPSSLEDVLMPSLHLLSTQVLQGEEHHGTVASLQGAFNNVLVAG